MRLKPSWRRRCCLFPRSDLEDDADYDMSGGLSFNITAGISRCQQEASRALLAADNPGRPKDRPNIGPPNVVDGELKGSNESEELFSCVLRALEFREECEITHAASMQNSPTMKSTRSSPTLGALPKLSSSRGSLLDVLRRLRSRELPQFEITLRLVEEARDHFQESCSSLVRLPSPKNRLVVVGDIHGHLNDLHHVLDQFGEPSEENQFLFNGDLVDRGDWGPEVLLTIFSLRLLYPTAVHVNRGNHEDRRCNDYYGFHNQIMHAYPRHGTLLYNMIQEAFDELPLCHVVGEKVFIVHGGIPLDPISLEDIEAVERGPVPIPAQSVSDRIFAACLWSDPRDSSGPSARGAGCRFDISVTRRFLSSNGLSCMLRSHECVREGVQPAHEGLVWTVFSASNYNNVQNGNNACVVTVDSNLIVNACESWNEKYVKERLSWKSESFHEEATIARLREQANRVKESASSSKDRALSELRRMIFLARPQLLQAFEEADLQRNGRISREAWAVAMSTCLRTQSEFPWLDICPYLCSFDHTGDIVYVDFLFRFYNPFSRWLADQWCRAVLNDISYHHGANAGMKFDSLDRNKGCRGSLVGLLSYMELRPFFHKHLPSTGREARLQEMHALALFRKMDTGRSGFVSRDEFLSALEEAAKQSAKCLQGHRLQEVVSKWWQRHERVCNACNRNIPHGEVRRHCATCDYDLCELCVGVTSRVQKQWDGILVALDVLCKSHCDARTLFSIADLNGDGFLDRAEFVACLGNLLQGETSDNTQVAEAIWDLAWQQDGMEMHGARVVQGMRVEDFVRCLAIVDAEG